MSELAPEPDPRLGPEVFRTRATTCPRCGSPIFHAVPGRTTAEDIRAFARLAGWAEVERDGWVHPGCYCAKGCVRVLAEYEPDLYVVAPGPNRERVILYVRQRLGLGFREARDLVDGGEFRIAYGRAARIARELQQLGAVVRYGWGSPDAEPDAAPDTAR